MKITVRKIYCDEAGTREEGLVHVEVEIRPNEDDGLCDVRQMTLSHSMFASLQIERGEIDAETFDRIEDADALTRAILKGINLLSFSPASAKALTQKLKTRGIDAAYASRAVEWLTERELLNEEKDALRLAECELRKKRGKRKILSVLFAKGYPDAVLRTVAEWLDENADFSSACLDAIRKKYHGMPPMDSPEDRKKVYAYLARAGFSGNDIREALSALHHT